MRQKSRHMQTQVSNSAEFTIQEGSWQDWWEKKQKRNLELVQAIKNQDVKQVMDLINEQKYKVSLPINEDLTPLHYAVQAKNLEIVKILVEQFAEINAQSKQLITPFHIACSLGLIDIVIIIKSIANLINEAYYR